MVKLVGGSLACQGSVLVMSPRVGSLVSVLWGYCKQHSNAWAFLYRLANLTLSLPAPFLPAIDLCHGAGRLGT